MNIPPKYEDVVAKLEISQRHLDRMIESHDALQQRLTVAEKRSAELEELLRDINDAPGGSQFKKHIDAALKPAAEGEGS